MGLLLLTHRSGCNKLQENKDKQSYTPSQEREVVGISKDFKLLNSASQVDIQPNTRREPFQYLHGYGFWKSMEATWTQN